MTVTMDTVDRAGKYAAILTVTENGLGGLLHAYHVPLTGHFLSLNQCFLLSRFVQQSPDASGTVPYLISLITAILKSLAPMGKRLTPMLAISIQGLLYTVGLWLFGVNLVGAIFGSILLSLWAYIQPALIYFIIFGKDIIDIGQFYFEEIQKLAPIEGKHVLYAFAFLVCCKITLAMTVTFLAFSSRRLRIEERLIGLGKAHQKKPEIAPAMPLTFRERLSLVRTDLMQPWFVFSLALCFLFFYLTNPSAIVIAIFVLRTLAIATLVFYAIRFLPLDRWVLKCAREESTFHRLFSSAYKTLKQ